MKRLQKNKCLILLFALCILASILYSADVLFIRGVFTWHRQQKEYGIMMAEVVMLFCLFSVVMGKVKKRKFQILGIIGVLAVFLWRHVVFLPVVVSGIYVGYLILLGSFLRTAVFRLPKMDGIGADFLVGSSAVILIYCFMSAIGVGAIPYLQLFAVVTGCGLFLWKGRKITCEKNPKSVFCMAFILTMFCIQAGRMNTAVDFDSLWYGLRSPFILDNGHGIYENIGTIGIVYTYSKGLEVLTLPLSNFPSYSFLLSFNLWLMAGVLMVAYGLARFYMGKGHALMFVVLLSAVPGIMNMSITMKTDIATLLFQEIMIYYILCYLKSETHLLRYPAYAISAFFLTWTLKPTALVFSTAIFGMSGLFLIWKHLLPQIKGKRHIMGSMGVVGVSLGALMGIWARTMMITGVPVTSVFSSIFTKIGFQMKYPFNINQIPNSGMDLSFIEKCIQFGKRAFGFLIAPVGPEMDHVILAWGGYLLLFLLLLWIVCRFSCKSVENIEEQRLSSYLNVIFIPFLVVNIICFAMLTQVDGNYFVLLYVLSGLFVFHAFARVKDKFVQKWVYILMIPVMAFLVISTSLTNWSWAVGFSPVSWKHLGYYDHLEKNRRDMAESGNQQIWDILSADPQNRLIAVGEHPQVLAFPCSVQSYDDITSSWGNVRLVKTMDNFVEFMDYAKTDYVYVQAGYMQEGARCYSLVRTLIEYGKLIPICYEEGNVLAEVTTAGEYTEKSRAALTEFDKCYIKR